MIKYSLRCDANHEFEAWFSSSSAYDRQAAARQVHCPVCGTGDVGKALMAPNVVSGRRQETVAKPAPHDAAQSEALQLMRKLRDFVEKNAEYVGPRFAEEALKIHDEEAVARNIYGEASRDEVDYLLEEGVDFCPLPDVPEDHN
jgi:hypothetical protein